MSVPLVKILLQFGIPGHRLVAVEGIAAADANVAETRICIEILQLGG